eukprot:2655260-Rhodomonas_salina.1
MTFRSQRAAKSQSRRRAKRSSVAHDSTRKHTSTPDARSQQVRFGMGRGLCDVSFGVCVAIDCTRTHTSTPDVSVRAQASMMMRLAALSSRDALYAMLPTSEPSLIVMHDSTSKPTSTPATCVRLGGCDALRCSSKQLP